jgi:hypothetical protein
VAPRPLSIDYGEDLLNRDHAECVKRPQRAHCPLGNDVGRRDTMIESIAGMPDGTIGVRVWGKVTAADYDDVLIPALQAVIDDRGEVRLVFQAGPDFEAFTLGMMGADVTTGLSLGVKHWSAWKRMAVVTDVEWLRHSMQMLGWMTPGEARLFGLEDLDEAKRWVAG